MFIRIGSHRARDKVTGLLTAHGFERPAAHWAWDRGYAYKIDDAAYPLLLKLDRFGKRIPGVAKLKDQTGWSECIKWS